MKGLFSIVLAGAISAVQAVDLKVSSKDGASVSPFFYGFMFEDINYSGDGGLYAELIENRNMKDGLKSYSAIGDAQLSIVSTDGLSTALPQSLKVVFPANSSGQVGFQNKGYDGIYVTKQPYNASFYVKSDKAVAFNVGLHDIDGNDLGSEKGSISGGSWEQHSAVITPATTASNVNNTLAVTFDASEVSGQTIYFSLVSLFPPTFKNRPNGLRNDIASTMNDLGAKFLRFPGGNNLEGSKGVESRWKWNETIGPLKDRPGRLGTWSYNNTDGLGLIEYLEWTIDMGLEPILAVWSGFVLDKTVVPEDQLQPYIDEALNELEFLLGDSSTTYGAQRAALGYPDPFKINHVEIGNEDNLNGGNASYVSYRFKSYAQAILAKYPDMNVIASGPFADIATQSNGKGWADYHQYDNPDHLVSLHHQFDNVSREIPVMVGEYAVIQGNNGTNGGSDSIDWNAPRLTYPNYIGAVAEATWLMGGERNADIVRAMCYAPLLNRVERTQWNPDLISFTSDPADTTKSTSYHVQQLFAHNVGDTAVAVDGPTPGPIYYSATKTGSRTFVKMANYNGTTTTVNVEIPGGGSSTATLSVLSAPDGLSYNSPGNDVVKLDTSQVTGKDGVFSVELADLNVAVLVVDVGGHGAHKKFVA